MFPGYASSVAKQNIFSSEKRNNPNSCKSQTPQYCRRRCCFQFFSKVLSSIKKIFFPLQAETKLTTASVPLCNGGGGGQNGNPVPPALSNNPNGNPAPTIAVQDASESSDQGPIKPNMAHKAWYMVSHTKKECFNFGFEFEFPAVLTPASTSGPARYLTSRAST